MIQVILFGEAIGPRTSVGPLTLAANEIAGNGGRTFVAGHAVTFHVGDDVVGVNAVLQ